VATAQKNVFPRISLEGRYYEFAASGAVWTVGAGLQKLRTGSPSAIVFELKTPQQNITKWRSANTRPMITLKPI
jgi:hypothetical protein